MANKNYVFYEQTNPFPGWIRFVGRVNPQEPPDGSTLKERLVALLAKYPDAGYLLLPYGPLPDPEAVKVVGGNLVPLAIGDITPKAQQALDAAQKEQDIADRLPSWQQARQAIDNISNLADAKSFLKKLTRVVYWLARNSKD